MSSGPVAESRFDSKLSNLSGEKDSPVAAGCDWVRWVQKAMGLEHKI